MEWDKLLYIIGAILIGILLYRRVRAQPNLFSSINITRSLQTLGLLALLLIAFVGMCVLLLKQ